MCMRWRPAERVISVVFAGGGSVVSRSGMTLQWYLVAGECRDGDLWRNDALSVGVASAA